MGTDWSAFTDDYSLYDVHNTGFYNQSNSSVISSSYQPNDNFSQLDQSNRSFRNDNNLSRSLPAQSSFSKGRDDPLEKDMFCMVQFKRRKSLYRFSPSLEIGVGSYVVTEADRGHDIGKVSRIYQEFNGREADEAQRIIRKASDEEIGEIPKLRSLEDEAVQICQKMATSMGLDMQISEAEYQFDRRKLTVTYSAKEYVDFRNLVKNLFKKFETRIWMVWHDGNAPVRDVLRR